MGHVGWYTSIVVVTFVVGSVVPQIDQQHKHVLPKAKVDVKVICVYLLYSYEPKKHEKQSTFDKESTCMWIYEREQMY